MIGKNLCVKKKTEIMKKSLIIYMLLIYTTSVLAYNPSSSLCDTSSNDVFFVTEIPPYCYNISADEMESMINKKITEKNISLTEGSRHIVHFLIDCYGNDFRHKLSNTENEALLNSK